MNPHRHNPEEINRYLLGSLTEAETERLDELSMTDAEFADMLGVAEKDMIDAYVQGELSEAVLQQFESSYLVSASGRAKVEFARAFQVMATKHQAAEAAADSSDESPTKASGFPTAGVFRFPRLIPQWSFAIAAALCLLLVGGWLLFESIRMTGRKPGIASFVLIPQTREAGQVPTFSIPPKTDQVVMTLELEPNDYSAYRAELLDPSDHQTLWRSDQLTASAKGNSRNLRISLPTRIFKPQNYVLRVTGFSTSGVPEIVGDYPFKF